MWFTARAGAPDWSAARRHLRRADKVMGRIIDRVGPCTLAPRGDRFALLCQAIFTQQLSMAVAETLFRRFRGLFARGRPTPPGVLRLLEGPDGEAARLCGLSRQKRLYLCDLARRCDSGELPLRRLPRMADQEVIDALTQVKGIGPWTAEMFLIFGLARPDLLPADDLGIRKAVQAAYGLKALPAPAHVLEIGERWKPWRTVATWYLWRM